MGSVNRVPSMREMLDALDRRVSSLERSRRVTIPIIDGYTNYPVAPQSGDIVMDGQTGALFVFCVDGNTVSTAATSITVGPPNTASIPVSDITGFRDYQTVAVDTGAAKYVATISPTLVPGTGAGYLPVNFLTVSTGLPAGFTGTQPTGTLPAGTKVRAATWRQLLTTTDFLAKFPLVPYNLAVDTSGSTITPGAGSKTFTVRAGLSLAANQRVYIYSAANPLLWMEGLITSYTTTSLVVTVDFFSGATSASDWVVCGPTYSSMSVPTFQPNMFSGINSLTHASSGGTGEIIAYKGYVPYTST